MENDPQAYRGPQAYGDRRLRPDEINASNDAGWSYTAGSLQPLHPENMVRISPERALVMAAWLVILAEDHATFSFGDALDAVRAEVSRDAEGGYRGSLNRAEEEFEAEEAERGERRRAEADAAMVAVLESLPRADCLNMLSTAEVGRLGLLVEGRPEVLPVNYALDGETVLFRTAEGTALNEAASRTVAFEVDHVDVATHQGWSVLVQGLARDIGEAVDPTSQRVRRLSLVTWAPGARQRWFRIDPDKITGRRLRVVPEGL